MASSPPLRSAVFPARKPSLAMLQHKHSDSVVFSSVPSSHSTDGDEQEARDELAPRLRLHRAGSVRRVSMTGSRRQLKRRYSVGEHAPPDDEETTEQHHEDTGVDQSSADQESAATQQSSNGGAKGLIEKFQRTVVLKRLSRSSLIPSPTSSFFAAAMAAATNAALKEDAAGQQYEEMMERFQIRRLQHTSSTSSASGKNDDPYVQVAAVRSAKVIPVDIDGMPPTTIQQQASTTPRSHSSNSREFAAKEPSQQTPSVSESATTQPSQTPPVLVIKPRSSIHKSHEGIAKVAKAGSAGAGSRFSLHWRMVSCQRRLRRRLRAFGKRLLTPISPVSTTARVRGTMLLLAFLSHAIYFPISVAFVDNGKHWFHYVDMASELVFMIDFVLSFNTSFLDKRGVLVKSRREIARNYLRTWCLPELLAAFPAESILHFRGESDIHWTHVLFDGIFRTQRLVHIVRILRLIWMMHAGSFSKSIWAWLIYSRYSHLVRIVWIVLLIVLLAHYMACCWKLLGEDVSLTRQSPVEQYIANFYDALQLLQGQGLKTSSIGQSVFASMAVLLGSVVFAIVFGNVAMLVSNFNANSTNYQRKMESVFAIMSKLQLPALLRERIHQYYEHLWREYESLDGEIVRFSKDLTHNLALEVVLFKYMDLVMNVPFWRDCTPDFQKQIVLSLQVRVYLPDDFILRRGEIGDEFYMINRGSCELSTGTDSFEQATAPLNPRVRDEPRQSSDASRYATSAYHGAARTVRAPEDGESEFDKRSRLKTERTSDHDGESRKKTSKYTRLLVRGQAFGEIALLMNYQRTANVRAVTYVEMCVLSRASFQAILTKYPDDRRHVLSMILIMCMESNETRQVYCPLKEIVKLVFADSDTEVADAITARYAANIIAAVVNPDYEDSTMKFGIGIGLRRELVKLKVQEEADSQHADPQFEDVERVVGADSVVKLDPVSSAAIPPNLAERIQKIESTQMQTLLVLQEMRAAMDELRHIPTPPPVANASAGAEPNSLEPMPSRSDANGTPTTTESVTEFKHDSSDGSVADAPPPANKALRVATRSIPFLRKRSTTAPDLLELSQALAHEMALEAEKAAAAADGAANSAKATNDGEISANKRLRTEQTAINPADGDKRLLARASSSRRRSVTLRDLTEKQKTELDLPVEAVKPLTIEQRARATFRLRKKSSQPDVRPVNAKARRNGSSLTKRLLGQHLGSFVSFMSASQQSALHQSPTCYADQLFQVRNSMGSIEHVSSEAAQE